MDENKTVSYENDLYKGLFENHPSKVASIFFSLFTSPLNMCLAYGVIWFEKNGNGNGRTLVNKMTSSLCFSGILYYLHLRPIRRLGQIHHRTNSLDRLFRSGRHEERHFDSNHFVHLRIPSHQIHFHLLDKKSCCSRRRFLEQIFDFVN